MTFDWLLQQHLLEKRNLSCARRFELCARLCVVRVHVVKVPAFQFNHTLGYRWDGGVAIDTPGVADSLVAA